MSAFAYPKLGGLIYGLRDIESVFGARTLGGPSPATTLNATVGSKGKIAYVIVSYSPPCPSLLQQQTLTLHTVAGDPCPQLPGIPPHRSRQTSPPRQRGTPLPTSPENIGHNVLRRQDNLRLVPRGSRSPQVRAPKGLGMSRLARSRRYHHGRPRFP